MFRRWTTRIWLEPYLKGRGIYLQKDSIVLGALGVQAATELLAYSVNGANVPVSTHQELEGDTFAKSVSEHYVGLMSKYYEFDRVLGLARLVAVISGLVNFPERPSLEFWLADYAVSRVDTPATLSVIHRAAEF